MPDVPPETFAEGRRAFLAAAGMDPRNVSEETLEAVDEAVAAAVATEREKIRRLATEHNATGTKCAKGQGIGSDCGCRTRNPRFPLAALLEPAP